MKLRRSTEEIARSCTSSGSASIPAAPCPGMRLLTGRGITADANLPNSPLRKKNIQPKYQKG